MQQAFVLVISGAGFNFCYLSSFSYKERKDGFVIFKRIGKKQLF